MSFVFLNYFTYGVIDPFAIPKLEFSIFTNQIQCFQIYIFSCMELDLFLQNYLQIFHKKFFHRGMIKKLSEKISYFRAYAPKCSS